MKIWDVATGERLYTLSEPLTASTPSRSRPTGQASRRADSTRRIRIWSLGPKSGTLLSTLIAHEDAILKLAWSPDGKLLASSSRRPHDQDSSRAADLTEIKTVPGQPDWAYGLEFSAGRRRGLVAGAWTDRWKGPLLAETHAEAMALSLAALAPRPPIAGPLPAAHHSADPQRPSRRWASPAVPPSSSPSKASTSPKPRAIYFSEPGVKGRILRVKELPDLPDIRLGSNGTQSTIDVGPLPPRNQVTVEVEIDPDAAIGPVNFRLLTPLGTSPEGRFLIEPYYGEAPDAEPNDTPETAFETFLPAILTGAISRPGDVD